MQEKDLKSGNMDKIGNDKMIKLDSPRVWRTYTGGRRLNRLHGNCDGKVSQYPEEWIMSVVNARNAGISSEQEDGMNHLPDYDNQTLKALIESAPYYYLGEKHVEKYGSFPGVLVKIIDSAERLTVQVHPDREMARRLFGSEYGKTECWHILDDTPVRGVKPYVYMGFKPGITKERWKELFFHQDVNGMLNAMHKIEVKKGDTILIKGGVPHAIGEGCFLMEIQEPTDYTIRVERVTPRGFVIDDGMCHQGIGFEKMFECFSYKGVTCEEALEKWFVRPNVQSEMPGGRIVTLIGYDSVPFFQLERIEVTDKLAVNEVDRFSGIYILKGKGKIISKGNVRKVEAGEQFFLPAGVGMWEAEADKENSLMIMRFMGPELREMQD